MMSSFRDQLRIGTGGRKAWASVGKSAGARMVMLPISAILGIVCTRVIIESYGATAYAQFGLLVGLSSLLPFADLGISAVIMNVVGESSNPAIDRHVRSILVTSIRMLFLSATALIGVSITITLLGGWTKLLGDGLLPGAGPLAAASCLCIIGAALPFGVGQRILAGLGKNHVTIALSGIRTPLVLLTLLILVKVTANAGPWLAIIPYTVALFLAVLTSLIASRKISPAIQSALRDVPRLRAVKGGKVFHVAWPMLIQMIALPIAMQTDRIILSHVSRLEELAQYNLASQMYAPIWEVTNAAGIALWPIFARQRVHTESEGESASPTHMALVFGGIAVAVASVITMFSSWLARLASGGEISLEPILLVSFSLLMIFQAAKVPLGMYMTDAPGLRFQAYMILLMLPVNLGLSLILARTIGAAGPVIGSAIGVILCQVLANWWYVRRQLGRVATVAASTEQQKRRDEPR